MDQRTSSYVCFYNSGSGESQLQTYRLKELFNVENSKTPKQLMSFTNVTVVATVINSRCVYKLHLRSNQLKGAYYSKITPGIIHNKMDRCKQIEPRRFLC